MKHTTNNLPVRAVLLYLIFGSLWILLSDQILFYFLSVSPETGLYNTLKGWLFILISGILLYSLLVREQRVRQKAEHDLRSSEERARLLFEHNHVVMLLIEPESGVIRDVNIAAAKFYGYPLSTLRGMNINEINQLSPEEVYAERMKALKEERNYFNFQHRLANGDIRSVEVYSAPMDVDGETILLSVIHDNTEFRKAQEHILFQAHLLENVNDAIVATDADFILQSWNRAAEKMYGWAAEEVIGKSAVDFIQSRFINKSREEVRKQVLLTGRFIGEATQLRKDGTRIPVEVANMVLRDDTGRVTGYVSVNRDISERKKEEENKARLAAIVESSSDAIIGKTLEGITTSWNIGAERMYGYTADEMIGKDVSILIPPELPDELPSILSRLKRGEHIEQFETVRVRKDGTRIDVAISISPIQDSAGAIIGASNITRDITDQKKAEKALRMLNDSLEQHVVDRTQELHKTNAELQRANRTKSEFLANMSHELRTPLNSILGLSETLLEQRRGPLNQKQIESLEWISNSGRHLLGLINDILEVSKIEAGKLELHPDVVSIKEVCESSLNFIREAALRKSISLHYACEPSLTTLKADPQRLKQILVNLLSNAVKFTPEKGSVSLEVLTNEQRDQVRFAVADNGIGIAASDLPRLFTPFTQVDSSLARQYSGTGLGLVLVFKFTEMHGGSVHVESEPNKGSRFTVNLPIGPSGRSEKLKTEPSLANDPQREETASQSKPVNGALVLYAEDNEPNIFTVGDYLEDLGFRVIVARDGLEAVQQAKIINPDIILMDIQMPVLNGLDAITILRKDPRFFTTPIIALTALAMPGDRERCLSAGADEYMSKPVRLKDLANTMNILLRHVDVLRSSATEQ